MNGADIVWGMTAPTLLDLRGVARLLGLEVKTVTNYHQLASRRRRNDDTRESDFPEPDMMFGRSPVWKLSTIREWQRSRPGQGVGGGRPSRETKP